MKIKPAAVSDKRKIKGCYACKHLDFYEAYHEEAADSGWFCSVRENIDPRRFPYKRKCRWASKLDYFYKGVEE